MKKFFLFLFAPLFIVPLYATLSNAGELRDVVVSTRVLQRNHIIDDSDVMIVTLKKSDARSVNRPELVVGKMLRRTIGKDTAIKRDYLMEAPLIRKGDKITIIAQSRGIRLTAPGKAKEDGEAGALVKIENIKSGKIIIGRVVDAGTARVNF